VREATPWRTITANNTWRRIF